MTEYLHSPLQPAERSIRLLRIERGCMSEGIKCRLFVSPLAPGDVPSYKALSYTWGGLEHTKNQLHAPYIVVEDCKFEVTENLYMALQQIRNYDQDIILWVDAICINQNDRGEKGHQVNQMRDVYALAEEVLIWLGPSNGFDGIANLFDLIMEIDKAASTAPSNDCRVGRMKVMVQHLRESNGGSAYLEQRRDLQELLLRPWFGRIWILQEVAHARTATVMCGSHSCPSRTFAFVPSLMELAVPAHTRSVLDIMSRFRKETWLSSDRSLHSLLRKFAESRASDARDQIYALLSISEDANDFKRFYPDYKKSDAQVFWDTACFILCGEIPDSSQFFPEYTILELRLPIALLAGKTLDCLFRQRRKLQEPQIRIVRILIKRINEGEIEKEDVLLSLVKGRLEVDEMESLMSHANFYFDIGFGMGLNFLTLKVIPTSRTAKSTNLIFRNGYESLPESRIRDIAMLVGERFMVLS